MNITRVNNAPEYQAAGHFDMRLQRLQGHEAGAAEQLWLGLSTLAPGGHTTLEPSPMEKHYVVLEGSVTLLSELKGQHTQAVLHQWDSACYAPGEKRQLFNHSDKPARVLLAMPLQAPVLAAPKETP